MAVSPPGPRETSGSRPCGPALRRPPVETWRKGSEMERAREKESNRRGGDGVEVGQKTKNKKGMDVRQGLFIPGERLVLDCSP